MNKTPNFDIDFPFIDNLMEGKSDEDIAAAKDRFRAYLRLAWEVYLDTLDEENGRGKIDV